MTKLLQGVWDSRILTNNGPLHAELEGALAKRLGVEQLSLFCNGTIALLVALQSLRINGGEVITTPFTFPATTHVLYWNRITPVFCDIDPKTYNLDPAQIERHIGPDTKAILPVHVYGTPCDVEGIQRIADRHGLHVIYDAAHAFGVRYRGRSLLDYGDVSMLSFHATKLYSTVEGGALVVRERAHRERINFLKNFGIADEETVIGPGINGKMNELQAAFGLLQLQSVAAEIENRRRIAQVYREALGHVPGITVLPPHPDTEENCSYFPILVDETEFGLDRDDLHRRLKDFNIVTRKYFYPLTSHYSCYAGLQSARPETLPVAERVSRQVLCLPIYGALAEEAARRIADAVAYVGTAR
jgi:dTDP-4-amino-4,6-dideoxygalactose transaminase